MLRYIFDQNAYFEFANGSLLKFWTKTRLGNNNLHEDFPDLFRISQYSILLLLLIERDQLDLIFRRNMQD